MKISGTLFSGADSQWKEKMADLTPLEQRKAEAKKYRGVSYDARMGKFVAMITINGDADPFG